MRQRETVAVMRRHEDAGRRARFERTCRETARRFGHHRSPARRHDVEPAREPERAQTLLQAPQIAVEHRLCVGIDRRRRPPFELAHFGENVGGGGYVKLGELGLDQRARAFLVALVGIAVEEADGERLDAVLVHQLPGRGAHADAIERLLFPPVIEDASRDLAAQVTRRQRLRKSKPQVEQVVPLLETHIEYVAEALGHQHADACALALDHGVRDQGRAVRDRFDVPDRDAGSREQQLDPVQDGHRRVGGRGQLLVDRHRSAARVEEREVRERAADIDAHAIGSVFPQRSLPSLPRTVAPSAEAAPADSNREHTRGVAAMGS